jgi:hypothetical protein
MALVLLQFQFRAATSTLTAVPAGAQMTLVSAIAPTSLTDILSPVVQVYLKQITKVIFLILYSQFILNNMLIVCINMVAYEVAGLFVKYSIRTITELLHLSHIHFNLNKHETLNFRYAGSCKHVHFQKFISTLFRSCTMVSHKHGDTFPSQPTTVCVTY